MLMRLYLAATTLLMLLVGGRRRRLVISGDGGESGGDGGVSLVYYSMGPRRVRRHHGDRPEGAVETWVLLHGLGGVAATWGPTLFSLARDCRVLVPELSALGGTAAPGGGLAVRAGAQSVTRLIEQEGGGRPVSLAGLSLGGWMAVRLALARPELVARLVLIDAAGFRDQNWDSIERLVTIADLDGVDRIYQALFGKTPWLMRHSRQTFLRSYTSPGVRTVLRETHERDTYTRGDLSRLAPPVALIWGEHDGLFTLDTARAMAAAIPHASLRVLAGIGHAVHLERPRALAAAIQQVRRETPEAPEDDRVLRPAESS